MADKTTNLELILTNDTDATTTTFKQWRELINGETGSNMQKIDAFAGTTNAALTNKVDKETGKGLSTNDFTNEDKAKVEAIPADPKYTDTTYTAGEGIFIDDTNTISAIGGGSGDVTAAGNNKFTGNNIFSGTNTFTAYNTFTQRLSVNGNSAFNNISSSGKVDFVFATSVSVPEPKANSNPATKKYVDDELKLKAGLTTANSFTGVNTFSGTVTVPTPRADNEAANKKYVDEKSKTTEKLATPRNIRIGGNAIGTAVPFDGSKDINIPISGLYNTALKWSDSGDTAGSITPIGTAIIPNFNANRIAFLPDDAIEVEYSTDGGNTWTNCTNHEANIDLTTLFNNTATSYSIGNKRAIGAKASINDKLRITFTAYRDNHTFVYCNIRKIFINVTTNGAIGSKVLIEKANIGTPNTFTTVKESRLEGLPAWNEINTTLLFGGGDYAPTQAKKLRFTFSITGLDETYSSALAVFGMYFMGENCWASSSTLAEAGHMYRIDSDKSCTFPGNIKTTGNFVGNLLGNATNDGNGNNIVNTYLKKENNPIVVSDTEPTNSNVSIWVDIS